MICGTDNIIIHLAVYQKNTDALKNVGGGNCAFELMRDYENRDLREVTVFYMSCMSAMYKQQSGVSFAEKFCEDNGIGTYTMDKENG